MDSEKISRDGTCNETGFASIASRISSVRDSSGALQSYTYLGLDTPVTFNSGNGVMLSYLGTIGATTGDGGDQYSGLDRFGRIIDQNWSTASTGAGIDQFAYGYDADSNVTYRQVTTNTSSGTINSTLAGMSQLYTYDGLNRLTNFSTGTLTFSGSTATITSPTSTEGWSLDALGNWKSSNLNGTNTNRSNSAQNQVTTVGTATLGYDLNGNTTKDQTGQTYVYDAWNRLVKVTGANGTVLASYSYDPEGRRITETQGTTTTDLYYSNRWQVVQESVGSLVTAEHVWSPFYVDSMIQTTTNPQVTTNQSNGSVDTGFGTNTSNHTTTTSLSSAVSFAKAAADGADIVVATIVGTTPELLFYNSSGGLDSAFGSGGIVSLTSWTNWTSITGIVVQANGKIDLAVQTSAGGMSVAQLTAAGAADTSFGTSGLETLSSLPAAQGIALAANGDLLVAGISLLSFDVAELNPSSGAADTSYNTSGSTSIAVAGSGSSFGYIGMAMSPDGDLVLLGTYTSGSGFSAMKHTMLAALNPAGAADSAFGTSGLATAWTGASFSTLPGTAPIAINAQGQILVGAASGSVVFGGGGGTITFSVHEFNANGSVDNSFGTSGIASVTDSTTDTGLILDIQTNGQIVIGAGGTGTNFVLARFNNNGSVDTTFGTSGIETGAAESAGLTMVVASNGEAVMVGTPSSGNGIVLQEFHTLATTFIYYVQYDANYNVTSITDASGNVLERYSYDPYGNVTVLNADGTTRGDGTAGSSFYGSVYLHQGLRLDVATGLYDDRMRQTYDPSLGRFLQPDPSGRSYIDGSNLYQLEKSAPIGSLDPSGLADQKPSTQPVAPVVISSDPQCNGSQIQRKAVQQAVDQIGTTKRGKQLYDMLRQQGRTITLKLNNNGNDAWDHGTDNINLDPDLGKNPNSRSKWVICQKPDDTLVRARASLVRLLAHELGHATTGTEDDGEGRLNNVNENENPIVVELGSLPRVQYSDPGTQKGVPNDPHPQ